MTSRAASSLISLVVVVGAAIYLAQRLARGYFQPLRSLWLAVNPWLGEGEPY